MNFWEIKLAATCVPITILAIFAYVGYEHEGNKTGMEWRARINSLCMSALLFLALWCIWGPYRYEFK